MQECPQIAVFSVKFRVDFILHAALAGEYWTGSGYAVVLMTYVFSGSALYPATHMLYMMMVYLMQAGLSEAKPSDKLPSA